MAGNLFSTTDVPEHQRYAYWQDLICDVLVNLDCTVVERTRFSGSIYNQKFAGLQLSTMVSDQMSLVRSRERIARAREDEFLVAFEGRAQSFGAQDGREAVLETGDFALFDSSRPYDVGFKPGFQHFVLKIPRSALLGRLGSPHALTGTRIRGDSGAGRLASHFFRSLQQELDGLDQIEADRLGQIGLDLLAAALASMAAPRALHETATRTAWIARIEVFIESRLSDPTLSNKTVASALGISPRYLNMLFAGEKRSVERWIWEQRLRRCHLALADPAQRGRSISDIAFSWGFNEMSHFSRAFRQRYDLSPREFRAASPPA